MALLGIKAPTLTQNGLHYRDLNKNGKLDTYEDSSQAIDDRVDNLIEQMTLEEKAGAMFVTVIASGPDGDLVENPNLKDPFSLGPTNSEMVAKKKMNHFNVVFTHSPHALASWNNKLQTMAEQTRLGIPVTVASDPRHGFGLNPAASLPADDFSQWPEPLGLAATRDTELVRNFADIAR